MAAHEWTELGRISRRLRGRPAAVQDWELVLLLVRAHVAQFFTSATGVLTLVLLYPLCCLVFWEAVFWTVASRVGRALGLRAGWAARVEPAEPGAAQPPWAPLLRQARETLQEWFEGWEALCEQAQLFALYLANGVRAILSHIPLLRQRALALDSTRANDRAASAARMGRVPQRESMPGLFVTHF